MIGYDTNRGSQRTGSAGEGKPHDVILHHVTWRDGATHTASNVAVYYIKNVILPVLNTFSSYINIYLLRKTSPCCLQTVHSAV